MNIKLKEDFTQVCVWEGTVMDGSTPKEFEDWILEEFKTRVQYLENIETKPDKIHDRVIEDTGGRSDLFFAIHNEDVEKFAIPRLSLDPPIRWIEDVLAPDNYKSEIYPKRVFKYKSWEA